MYKPRNQPYQENFPRLPYANAAKFSRDQWNNYPRQGMVYPYCSSHSRPQNVHKTYYNDSIRPFHDKHQQRGNPRLNRPKEIFSSSPGQMLFHAIKDHANNLYSLHLMRKDLELSVSSPQKNKEFYRIKNALNRTQVLLQNPENIKSQYRKLDQLILDLTSANTKVALSEYELKCGEQITYIQSLLRFPLKYIPKSESILRYVHPNMKKRRFYDIIFPQVSSDIGKLIEHLCAQHDALRKNDHINSANAKDQHAKAVTKPDQVIMDVEPCLPQCSTHLHNQIAPNNPDAPVKNNKRKIDRRNTIMSSSDDERDPSKKRIVKSASKSSISSLNDIDIDIDLDGTPEEDITPNNIPVTAPTKPLNSVSTVSDSFNEYKTLLVQSSIELPPLSSPPDTAHKLSLTRHIDINKEMSYITQACETAIASSPCYSLITLHNQNANNVPKSHIHIEIPVETTYLTVLESIMSDRKFVYEIVLQDDSFYGYQLHLKELISWIKEKNHHIMITVPSPVVSHLELLLGEISVIEIQRPFRSPPCTSVTT
jgi:hypothetical protein